MTATIENNEWVIRVPLQEPTPSSSGKTLIVASSHGNQTTTAMIDGTPYNTDGCLLPTRITVNSRSALLPLSLCLSLLLADSAQGEPFKLNIRSRQQPAPQSGRYHAITQPQEWEWKETAIVVCDMW